MRDILQEIIVHKRLETEVAKRIQPLETLAQQTQTYSRPSLSMRQSLEQSASGIIAEFKRRSPSKGWINESGNCADVVAGYTSSGASACSVLIDEDYFGGSINDLRTARHVVPITPLLYKEFIVDPYQIYEARLSGADALLLIASCLTRDACEELSSLAHELSLEVLLEIHTIEELAYLNHNIDMLGVNNRHLGTFHTDINQSFALARAMRNVESSANRSPLLVSESGISDPETVVALREVGFRGFLMGEAFMKTNDPALELSTFIARLT